MLKGLLVLIHLPPFWKKHKPNTCVQAIVIFFTSPSILSLNRKMCSKYSCCNQDCIVSKQPAAEECRTSANTEWLKLYYSDIYQFRPAEQGVAWLLYSSSALRDHLHSDCWSWSATTGQQKAVELSWMCQ